MGIHENWFQFLDYLSVEYDYFLSFVFGKHEFLKREVVMVIPELLKGLFILVFISGDYGVFQVVGIIIIRHIISPDAFNICKGSFHNIRSYLFRSQIISVFERDVRQ